MQRSSSSAVGLIVLVPGLSSTKGVSITLDELYKHAQAVVIGEVAGVVEVNGHRYADIQVEQILKGAVEATVRVIAESTWRCDVSDAVQGGARVVLFLGKRDPRFDNARSIEHAGRGYFPFVGREHVGLLNRDLELPSSLADEVQRRDREVILTTDVFVRYLSTLD
jgi:hypothetical protein